MDRCKLPSAVIVLTTLAVLALSGCGGLRTLPPSVAPVASPALVPAANASSAVGQALDCGPLRPNLLECLQVVQVAADSLSSDFAKDQVYKVQVLDGRSYPWCVSETSSPSSRTICIDAPVRSAYVQFNRSNSMWERVPVYVNPVDPSGSWQAGFPFDLPSYYQAYWATPSPSLMPS